MSVFITGMEAPEDCRECMLLEYHDRTGKTWCKPADKLLAEDRKPIQFDGRPDWCPIAELPEKHGDLIDRDELIDDLKYDVAMDQDMLDFEELSEINRITIQADKDLKQNAIDLLKHSRAVIEAEGER